MSEQPAAQPAPRSARSRQVAPWRVTAFVLVIYGLLAGSRIATVGTSPFIDIGKVWLTTHVSPAHRSAAIASLHPTTTGTGYDGQFAYFIDLDPLRARYYIDDPPYRYGRILYPAAAWVVAAGQRGGFPYSLVLINLFAILVTVQLLARYLSEKALSPWWAAVYGFFPGVGICLAADLVEPLGFLLAVAGLLALDRRPEHALRYAPLFALAALDRETTVLVTIIAALWLALRGRSGRSLDGRAATRAGWFLIASLAPFAAYRLVLSRWIPGSQLGPEQGLTFPFGGIAYYWPFDVTHIVIVLDVVVPGLLWLWLALVAARRRALPVPIALIVTSALLFDVFLPQSVYVSYQSANRALIPLVAGAILALPALATGPQGELSRLTRVALISLTPVWLAASILLAESRHL